MATKIRRCLYIGLGGTGMTSLLHTKKMFMETYGEVPPMIAFLGVDTDGGWYKKELDSKYGPVRLEPNEQMPILVDNARDYYQRNEEHMGWLPQENKYGLQSMTLGAGQIRSNGRFAFVRNYASVERMVKTCIANITSVSIVDNHKYELLGSVPEIHMVFSVCGGTGSGTFLDMAYLVRKVAEDSKLTGYAILPDVFDQMSSTGMAKVKPNAYGAIQDLDYLMHFGLGDEMVMDYVTSEYVARQRPFNAFFFIDNKNASGDTYTHVDMLTEMVSLSLVTSAGELSVSAASVTDNLEKNIREGTMDVKNKKAWAAGLGVSQIVFRGGDIAEIYSLKAAQALIDRMLACQADINTIVNAWIDMPEVNIRENNGFNNLTDALLKQRPTVSMTTVDDRRNAMAEVDSYMLMAMPKDGDVEGRQAEITNRVTAALEALLVKHINMDGGVRMAELILDGLRAQIEVMQGEMKQELLDLQVRDKQTEQQVKASAQDLQDYAGRFFKRQAVLEEHVSDVVTAAINWATVRRDTLRHNAAITIYTALLSRIMDLTERIASIERLLQAVSSDLASRLAMIQNHASAASRIFQIDLSRQLVTSIGINNEEVSVSDFVHTLPTEDGIYAFDPQDKKGIMAQMTAYGLTLPGARHWSEKSIDEVLADMDDTQLDGIIRSALRKAEPLLTLNYQGYTTVEPASDMYYVGVPNKATSPLARDNRMRNMLAGNVNMDFASVGSNDSVIVYHQVGVIPPYAITSVPRCEEKAAKCNCNCHFDALMERRMEETNYSLYPEREIDDAIELWVKGLIFGRVKNEDGMYYCVNKRTGRSLRQFWVELASHRDEAYDAFRRSVNQVRDDYNRYFEQIAKEEGEENMQMRLSDAQENYVEKYSQVGMTVAQIEGRGNERLMDLMEREMSCLAKML